MRSGAMTSTSSRQHIARMKGLSTRSLMLDRSPMPQPATLWPSLRNVLRQQLALFSSKYYQVLITAPHLSTPQGWKAELAWATRVPPGLLTSN